MKQDEIGGYAVIAFARVLGLLPLSVTRAIGAGLGRLVWWLKVRSAATTIANIDLCFAELTAGQRRDLCRRSLVETGRLLCEIGFVWHANRDVFGRAVTVVEGAELLEAARSNRRGTLILVPHFGNWEILGFALGLVRPTFLYQPPKASALEAAIVGARTKWGTKVVPADVGGMRAMMRALAAGEVVGLLPDQVPASGAGVLAPFFGVDTQTMTLVHRMLQADTRVLMATARRVPRGFELRYEAVEERIHDPDPIVSATAMNAAIEAVVRREPAQYQWEYKRFRKRRERR